MHKEFLKSSKGFLRAALTMHSHSSPVWKIAEMAIFDTCMEFEIFLDQMTSFEVLLKCHSLTLSKKYHRLCLAPSKCLSERINWIISRIPHRISKIIFVYGSYEFLAMLQGKIRETPVFLRFNLDKWQCALCVIFYFPNPFTSHFCMFSQSGKNHILSLNEVFCTNVWLWVT